MFFVRKLYYHSSAASASVPLVRNFTGFGLYDRAVMEELREIDDPYPYFRGLISDIGFERAEIHTPSRRGSAASPRTTSTRLYDMAMLGITNHSKVPLRLATMAGFAISLLTLLVALGYLVAKLSSGTASSSASRRW